MTNWGLSPLLSRGMADITERNQANQLVDLYHKSTTPAMGQQKLIHQLLQGNVSGNRHGTGVHDLAHGSPFERGLEHELGMSRLGATQQEPTNKANPDASEQITSEEQPDASENEEVIPTCVLSDHSQMGKMRHRANMR